MVGAVLALHRHAPAEVERLEAVGLVAALLQLVQRIDALVRVRVGVRCRVRVRVRVRLGLGLGFGLGFG